MVVHTGIDYCLVCFYKVSWLKGNKNKNTSWTVNRRKCANIFSLHALFGSSINNIYKTCFVLLLLIWAAQGAAMVVHYLLTKNEKGWPTIASLLCNVIDKDCWEQSGSTCEHVSATHSRRFAARRMRNGVLKRKCCVYIFNPFLLIRCVMLHLFGFPLLLMLFLEYSLHISTKAHLDLRRQALCTRLLWITDTVKCPPVVPHAVINVIASGDWTCLIFGHCLIQGVFEWSDGKIKMICIAQNVCCMGVLFHTHTCTHTRTHHTRTTHTHTTHVIHKMTTNHKVHPCWQ